LEFGKVVSQHAIEHVCRCKGDGIAAANNIRGKPAECLTAFRKAMHPAPARIPGSREFCSWAPSLMTAHAA